MPKNPGSKQENPTRKSGKPGPLGEGNYEATRKYNDGVMEHMRNHDIEQEARDAEPRSESEAQEMKDAEIEAGRRSKGEDPALRKTTAKKKSPSK
ncbi:hypothetical protein [Usitatibacter palustris]|uniref:Uncharacterized protein n=1 Tax=Usitatibacter palustris TaxID=2732487 RepID=A0A6M4H7A9_9PROT|nr:hypothetical protein [Usitatibacter palustris]QJR15521.1 hypothetical protein DSM104440_02342 [Usitatibacter palustris]